MTAYDAISRVDRLKYNVFSQAEKLRWLGKLEGMLKTNILDTHEGDWRFTPVSEDSPVDTPLLLQKPFDEMYIKWLEAQIDLYNGETERYNASISLFNTEYAAFESWFNRRYTPRSAGSWQR